MHNIKRILKQLNLADVLSSAIEKHLKTVSYYRMIPYINFVCKNKAISDKIISKTKNLKNNWDLVIYLYRYNIKLSITLYPYIFLLETALKTNINNLMCTVYGEDWFKNEELFFKAHNLVDNIDKDIFKHSYEEYIDIGRAEETEIIKLYEDYNNQLKLIDGKVLSKKYIRNKVYHIKQCVYKIREVREALKKNKNLKCIDFVEDNATLGYWLSLLQNKYFWRESEVSLKNIFRNGSIPDNLLADNHSNITKRLNKIRMLRNQISHYGQIIGKDNFKDFSLYEAYEDILYLFMLIGLSPKDDLIVNELKCNNNVFCKGRSFSILFQELRDIHNCYIKAEEINFYIETKIDRSIVKSEDIKSIGYDSSLKILEIEFESGAIFRYANVPVDEYSGVIGASSILKHFNKNIRYSYNYKRIKESNRY